MSESEYVVAAIRERLAEGAAHELGVTVRVDDGRGTVAGVVDSPAAHRRVLDAVGEVAPELELCDDLEVLDVSRAAGGPERL